jgi:hypothetical protein
MINLNLKLQIYSLNIRNLKILNNFTVFLLLNHFLTFYPLIHHFKKEPTLIFLNGQVSSNSFYI